MSISKDGIPTGSFRLFTLAGEVEKDHPDAYDKQEDSRKEGVSVITSGKEAYDAFEGCALSSDPPFC